MQTQTIDGNLDHASQAGEERGANRRRIAAMLLGGAAATLAAGIANAQPRIVPDGTPSPGPGAPPAQSGTMQTISLDAIMPILSEAGYGNPRIEKNDRNVSFIRCQLKGATVAVHLNCSDSTCSVLYFIADFGKQDSVDADYMNAWNRHFALSALYRFDNGDLAFRFGVSLVGGFTMENVKSNAHLYIALFDQLLKFNPKGSSPG
jgi:hypothetical protein